MKLLPHKYIHEFLEFSAKRYPNKIALIHEDTRVTYTEINTKANALAKYLIESGVKTGDRVAMILENSIEYVISYYGALKTGAVVVPLSTDLKPAGLNPLLSELEPVALITNNRFERLVRACDHSLIENLKIRIQNFNVLNIPINTTNTPNAKNQINDLRLKIDDASCACIIYTSGSTGKPKGVMLSHANIVSNVDSICQYLQLTEKDIQMVVLPFFYVMGKSLLNTHFAVGGTVVINNKFAYPVTVIQQMAEENVTGFSGVPSTYAYLLHRSPLNKYREKLPVLRYCSQAGGHMARQIKEELPGALPEQTKIFIMYGATEAGARLTYLEPEKYFDKIDSIGKGIPNVTVQVVDKTGNKVEQGQLGELVAAGDNIFMGYWKNEEETNRVLDNFGYHTGDTGYQDEEGFLFVTGRKDDLVKVGGHRINPLEVEDAMVATKLVIEAAVVGIPDDLLDTRLVALAVLKKGEVSEQTIIRACSERLPKYKLPESIRLIRALPRYSNGKINKEKCSEMLYTR